MKRPTMRIVVTLMVLWSTGVLLFAQEVTNPAPPAATVETLSPVVETPPVSAPEATVAPTATNLPPVDESVVPTGEQEIEISYSGADLPVVVRSLAAKAGLNLIIGEEVIGKVTVNLKGTSYEEAIRLIVESKGYAFIKDKNVIKVKSRDSLEAEPVEVQVFTLNYAKAEDVRNSLESTLTKQGKIQVDARSNLLIVSDTPSSMSKVATIIQTLDTQTPQVMIEARFVETGRNPTKNLGINWSGTLAGHKVTLGQSPVPYAAPSTNGSAEAASVLTTPVDFTATRVLGALGQWTMGAALLNVGQASAVFSFLNTDGDSELLANPRVVTVDNVQAKIAIADQVPIPNFAYSEQTGAFTVQGFTWKEIGVILKVTPRINKNEFVTLEVIPEVSDSSSSSSFQGIQLPIISVRTATTTVLVKSRNTLVIGGLMRQSTSDTYTKVPLMGDIPGLGVLFRSKSLVKTKKELLIFITPTIISPEEIINETQLRDAMRQDVYANDKWLPKDNAKPHKLFQKDKKTDQPTQNFQGR